MYTPLLVYTLFMPPESFIRKQYMDYQLLVFLLIFHFIFDFSLQGEFVATHKARVIDGKRNPIWGWVMTAHCAAHTLPVLIFTGSLLLSGIMFVSHFITDTLKCQNSISFNQDQFIHIDVILVIWGLYIFGVH